MLTSSRRNRMRNRVDAAASPPSLAVFAAHRATSLPFLARSLPPLPPITATVKLPHRANRLQFRLRARSPSATKLKNGKNGNVHWRGQHCHPPSTSHALSPLSAQGEGPGVRTSGAPRKLNRPAQERNWLPAAEPPLYLVYSLLPKTRGAIVGRVAHFGLAAKGNSQWWTDRPPIAAASAGGTCSSSSRSSRCSGCPSTTPSSRSWRASPSSIGISSSG